MKKLYYTSRLRVFNENNETIRTDADIYHGENRTQAEKEFDKINYMMYAMLNKDEHAMRVLYEVVEDTSDPMIKYNPLKIFRTH